MSKRKHISPSIGYTAGTAASTGLRCIILLLSLIFASGIYAQETTDTIRTKELEHIIITPKTESQRAQEKNIRATVVDTRRSYQLPASLNELMTRSAGVRIRQSGGIGSATEISLNGFQGKAIRFLKDGIPVDYLREGFSISSIPVNTLERVEIYKGVLPVSLGVDALGGAVNLVTRKAQKNYLAASYEAASFHTHRATINGQFTGKNKKWFAGFNSFYNNALNDYKVRVKVTDTSTGNQYYDRVRLFHNKYESIYGEINAGLLNRTWADELVLTLSAFRLERQQNHPALMTDPYGAVTGSQSSIAPTLRYKKTFLDKRISIEQFLVKNTVEVKRTDTLSGRYDWYGHFYPIAGRIGESRQPALSDIRYANFTSRTYISFRINTKSRLELNNVFTGIRSKGTDPYGPKIDNTDIAVISLPATYNKLVSGLGLTSDFFDKKLEISALAKFYFYNSSGTEAWQARPILKSDEVSKQGSYGGAAIALKYSLSAYSYFRLSSELANRLPDQTELFGDGIWTVPNFSLSPERSLNINLGYHTENEKTGYVEVNSFYRKTKDLILLIPVQPPYAQYQNVQNVNGFGLEADGLYHLHKQIDLNANFTWQDIRLAVPAGSANAWQDKARLRNTPYFFANAGITINFENLLSGNDRLKVYSWYNFVKEFYLETIPRSSEPKGFAGLFGSSSINTELIIPDQHLWSGGISYSPSKSVAVAFETKNILNSDLYDNYRVQKAGRSFHLKINYTLQ